LPYSVARGTFSKVFVLSFWLIFIARAVRKRRSAEGAQKVIDFLSECGYHADLLMKRDRKAVFLCTNRREPPLDITKGRLAGVTE